MTLYWYDNQWQVASSGSPDASGKVNERGLTYAELFWKVWQERGYQLPRLVPQGVVPTCYMFELMTPFNRIITQQGANRLLLHGARNLLNLKELEPEAIAATYGWECVSTYNLTTWDGVLQAAQELDPMASEGYIVCDAQFNRVKVKSPQYVALSHLKGEFSIHRSIHRMLEIVRANEGDEFLNYYPKWKALYTTICERYQKLKVAIETDYAKLRQIELQKDFAKAALRTCYPGILFCLRNRKIATVADGLAGMPIKSLETLLNIQPSMLIEETHKVLSPFQNLTFPVIFLGEKSCLNVVL